LTANLSAANAALTAAMAIYSAAETAVSDATAALNTANDQVSGYEGELTMMGC
jgi:hypothetical protein